MLPFIIGVSIPLIFCLIFWKELRTQRERLLNRLQKKNKEDR